MAAKQGINVPIYKIDLPAVFEQYGEMPLAAVPQLLVDQYNTEKDETVFDSEGVAEIAESRFDLYRNIRARPNTSDWVAFFADSGISLAKLQNQMQHLVCFVTVDKELYVYTAGQSAVVFERYIDVSFPIEVGRRVAKGEIKGARANQITGVTLASDMHFRDARRITYAESLDTVWTSLSGQLRDAVVADPELTQIFGPKTKIRIDVTGAVRLGPKIDKPATMVSLIRWLAKMADAELPEDDAWAVLDTIKVLNPRKRKVLIRRLRAHLANEVFLQKQTDNLALAHSDPSLYENASGYSVQQGREVVYDDPSQPDLASIVASMEIDQDDLDSNFTSVRIVTRNDDYGPGYGTAGTLFQHLNGEVRFEGRTYFLIGGKWYEVDAKYVNEISRDFRNIVTAADISSASIGLRPWRATEHEGPYNDSSITHDNSINGDRVLCGNIELFDTLAFNGDTLDILHVKKDFNVKIRDVRSQLISSAQIIENDLRTDRAELKSIHGQLVSRGRTTMSQEDFLALFDRPRRYILCYGRKTKVDADHLPDSNVARMELVSLQSQFRQLSSSDDIARFGIAWVEMVD